jgi:hypothetical protein
MDPLPPNPLSGKNIIPGTRNQNNSKISASCNYSKTPELLIIKLVDSDEV